jgi:hypothetical protein
MVVLLCKIMSNETSEGGISSSFGKTKGGRTKTDE